MNSSRKSNLKIPGIKTSLQNSQLLTSSGIPSLDHVIGGGLPIGSVFLVEEDEYGCYSNVLLKYYLSEGVICKHKLLLATLDSDPEKLLSELPSVSTTVCDNNPKSEPEMCDNMKIAWRYNSLTPIQSTLGTAAEQFGHYFDMNKPIGREAISNIEKKIWKFDTTIDLNDSENVSYKNLLKDIKNEIENFKVKDNVENSSILRICIQSLGSPNWQIHEKHHFNDDLNNEATYLIQFLYHLRTLLRSTYAVVFLTIPALLFKNPNTILRIRHLVDASIKLDAFAGTDRELNPALRDYHGLFYMPKLLSLNTIAPFVPPTLDLSFKLRRKKFLIEKLHLPPELQESEEREQDDGSLLSCSSVKKRNLDF